METREFLDLLYAHWAKTTGAQDMYWMPEEHGPVSVCETDDGLLDWVLCAVDEKQEKKLLGSFIHSEDADFITAIHGCLPDLVRTVHTALDEADRLDEEKDALVVRIAELEIQVDDLKGHLEKAVSEVECYYCCACRLSGPSTHGCCTHDGDIE